MKKILLFLMALILMGSCTKNTKSEVFAFEGVDLAKSDAYQQIYDQYGYQTLIYYLEMSSYYYGLPDDEDLSVEAKLQAEKSYASFEANDQLTSLNQTLTSLGFKEGMEGLTAYITLSMKYEEWVYEIIANDYPNHEAEYIELYQPRIISHILVAMDDPQNPTEEEAAKLKEVQDLVASGEMSFADIAIAYSDDGGSGYLGGLLGYTDRNYIAAYVTSFAEHIYSVGVGENSEWFASEYGWHIIHVDSESFSDFLGDATFEGAYLAYYPEAISSANWDLIQSVHPNLLENEDLTAIVKSFLGVK
ncbi:MAG: peptidylprolyl isomerase [Erysipelotrichaceae bacterium]|nr:peptidylprolyl isomerase [Erysipelotrichaceae bacterium]